MNINFLVKLGDEKQREQALKILADIGYNTKVDDDILSKHPVEGFPFLHIEYDDENAESCKLYFLQSRGCVSLEFSSFGAFLKSAKKVIPALEAGNGYSKYHIGLGSRFVVRGGCYSGNLYMLVSCGGDEVVLACIASSERKGEVGCRFDEKVKVSDAFNLTLDEFKTLFKHGQNVGKICYINDNEQGSFVEIPIETLSEDFPAPVFME